MSPWRDRRIASSDPASGRFGWLRLNADTLFLALLAAGSGVFDLINPHGDAVVAAVDHAYPLFYLRVGCYIAAGLMLIYALALGRVRPEVLARSVLLTGIVVQSVRCGIVLGWGSSATVAMYVLWVIVSLTTWLRLSMLLNPGGLMVTRAANDPTDDL